ncbi:unnamed protein product [Diplocarpon coronariae]|uniref:Extracellular serine-rich protein n=1 Tax=Diplocarpon coronariae TaxID=2795749 RepID=A0A218Z8K6_9HELO|nr:hypothetical protein B2J93_7593 [Marssonina coronariae]
MLFNTFSMIALLAAGSAIASPIITPADSLVEKRAGGQTWVVVVGDLNNPKAVTFTPNKINAAAGDTVQYQFVSANHTATQASGPDSACKPMKGGVNSGFMPVQQNAKQVKTFSMTVQDANTPMYMYCAAANHCQQGMVMTINANAKDAGAFRSNAAQAKNNVAAKKVQGGQAGQVSRQQVGQQGGGQQAQAQGAQGQKGQGAQGQKAQGAQGQKAQGAQGQAGQGKAQGAQKGNKQG